MKTFRNTCPDWCDGDHEPEIWDETRSGHTEHKTVLSHEEVTVDLVQIIEFSFEEDRQQWMVTQNPPRAVLGTEFDNAVNLNLRQLRQRIAALEAAHVRLTDLALEFAKESQ